MPQDLKTFEEGEVNMSLRLWRRLHTERGPRADSWVQVGFGYGRKGGCARTNGLYEDVEV